MQSENWRYSIERWCQSCADFLLPRLCAGCGRQLALQERLVCAHCQLTLPLETNHDWLFNHRKMLWSDHTALQRMAALVRYERDNIASEIVRSLKFRRQYKLGDWMGRTAVKLLDDTGLFSDIDFLVPIPLTRQRLHVRGFNQAEAIARGISAESGIPLCTDVLRRLREKESQTHFTFVERLSNADHVFAASNYEALTNRHIMIVDDVMTTGATMLGAITALETIPDIHISTFAWAWVKS